MKRTKDQWVRHRQNVLALLRKRIERANRADIVEFENFVVDKLHEHETTLKTPPKRPAKK